MAKHRAKRYGICGVGGLLSYIPIPIPQIFPDVVIDVAVRGAISFGIGFGIARMMKWNNE